MGETKEFPAGFAAAVLAWLNAGQVDLSTDDPAVELTACSMYGTDWAGDTNSGFYSEHDLTLSWKTAAGRPGHATISGEKMSSLWNAVVAAWPKEPT